MIPLPDNAPGRGRGGRTRPRVLLLVAATVGAAVLAIAGTWSDPAGVPFAFWLCLCLAGELLWVRLPVGSATVSMASCFHLAGLLTLPAAQMMVAAALSVLAAESLVVRKPLVRSVFNASQAALSVGAASWMVAGLSGVAPPGTGIHDFGPLALVAAALAYFALNSGFVSLAVALHERLPFARVWRENFGARDELLANGALFSLGALVAGAVSAQGVAATSLLLLPLLVVYQGYRWYALARSAKGSESR